jgi:hypothetical protein
MQLSDLPEFRAKAEEFERAGTELLKVIEDYQTHGISPLRQLTEYDIRSAVLKVREDIGEGQGQHHG